MPAVSGAGSLIRDVRLLDRTMSNQRTKGQRQFADAIGLLLFIVFLPLIIVALTLHLLAGLFLHFAIWCCWCSRGRDVLFVYSDISG